MTIASVKREFTRVMNTGGAFPADTVLCAAIKAFKESTGKSDRDIAAALDNQISTATVNRCVNRAAPAIGRLATLVAQERKAIRPAPSIEAAPSMACRRMTAIQGCKAVAAAVDASGGHITDRVLGDMWGMSTSWANRHRK